VYLEERTDFSQLGLGSKETKGQNRANVLRYGVEVGDEAIGHLWQVAELRNHVGVWEHEGCQALGVI
jgi:hypothetical protein